MSKPILTMDLETDPFTLGHGAECRCGCRIVHPFACGLFDGKNFTSIWHPKCCDKMVKILERMEPSIIYMHNGGRFDDYHFYRHFKPERQIIGNRIAKAFIGHHEFRDSMSIIPVALKETGQKKDIEIWKLERAHRDTHRIEILEYLKQDCIALWLLVNQFREEFGDYLTIASAAMAQLKRFHQFEHGNSMMDERFRSQFFFGGRVQCFAAGVVKSPFKIHDMNSAYPYVMRNMKHPTGDSYAIDTRVNRRTAFVIAEGKNDGAFPLRKREGGIEFTTKTGQFCCSIHEWNMAEHTGMFRPQRVIKTYDFDAWITFDGFVDHFYGERLKAQSRGDEIHKLFYKLILNSAYGKFAQNPQNYVDQAVTLHGQQMPPPWEPKIHRGQGDAPMYTVWQKPIVRHSYYNVAIGASITGGTRAMLMEGLHKADTPFYCDTDSIISRDLSGVRFSKTELGAWKFEGAGTRLAIAGKKTYACFDDTKKCSCDVDPKKCQHHVKSATKGARIGYDEIVEVAEGGEVVFHKLAPTYKQDGRVDFISRRIKRTV